MIPTLSWIAPYQRGLERLQGNSINEALKEFDEAVRLGGSEVSVLPSRDTVLWNLHCLRVACSEQEEGNVDLQDDEGNFSEAYARRLFIMLSKLPAPIQLAMFDSSSSPSPSPSPSPSSIPPTVLRRAQARLSRLRRTRNLIDFMPPEILNCIGRHLVEEEGSSDISFILSAVSRRWRTVFTQDPAMWGLVRLEDRWKRDELDKLLAHLGKGDVRELFVWKPEGMVSVHEVLDALKGRMGSLRTFSFASRIDVDLGSVCGYLQYSPNLQTLRLRISLTGVRFSDLPSLPYKPIPSLLHLELSASPNHDEIYLPFQFLFLLSPNLQTIDTTGIAISLPTSTPIVLPNLTNLTLRDSLSHSFGPVPLSLPRLERLDLSGSFYTSHASYLFPSSFPPNVDHLTHLKVSDTVIPEIENELINQLELFVRLTHLNVEGMAGIPSLRLLDALTVGEEEGSEIVCRELEEVKVKGGHLRGAEEMVARMVQSRLEKGGIWLRIAFASDEEGEESDSTQYHSDEESVASSSE